MMKNGDSSHSCCDSSCASSSLQNMASTLARVVEVLKFDFGSVPDFLEKLTSCDEQLSMQSATTSLQYYMISKAPEALNNVDRLQGTCQMDDDEESCNIFLVGTTVHGWRHRTVG